MRQPREPTTRKEIDAEIQRLSDEISDIRADYRATVEDIIEGTESFVHNSRGSEVQKKYTSHDDQERYPHAV